MPSLPTPGADAGVWGTELNTWLTTSHNSDGSAKTKPWQFSVDDPAYAANGDGKVVADVSTTSGSKVITSATAGFVNAAAPAGDVGKYVMINGGNGTTSGPYLDRIASVQSATQATLTTANAGATASNCPMVWGTDDTTAINNAVAAAGTYATSNDYFAEVLFGAKIYILGAAGAQTGNGTSTPTFNAQIPLPYPNANGTTRKLVIQLAGAGDAAFYQYWESTTPNLAGTVLVSMTTAPSTPSATFGNQSVIGGPSGSAGYTGGFANVKAVIKGIQVVCGAYTNQYAFDLGYVSAMRVTSCSAHIFAPSGVNGGTSPLLKDLPAQAGFQGTIGAGLRAPVVGNNAEIYADDFTAEGFARGLYVFDHFTAAKISTLYNDVALKVDLTQGLSGVSHGVWIGLMGCEVYNGGISVTGGTAYVPLYVNMDAECAGVSYDVLDSGNVAFGVVHWTDPADARSPTVTGAANLAIVNDKLGPGVWSGKPAAPGNNVAQTNAAYRNATVYCSATTGITVVKVDSTTTGQTGGNNVTVPVRVPSGHSFTLTYTGTLTTTWILE